MHRPVYHVVTPTLPFSKEFTEKYKMRFLKEYVLNKERLLKVLPWQMKYFTEDELNQRYSSYFAKKINGLKDVIKMAGIREDEIEINCLKEEQIEFKNIDENIRKKFPTKTYKKCI